MTATDFPSAERPYFWSDSLVDEIPVRNVGIRLELLRALRPLLLHVAVRHDDGVALDVETRLPQLDGLHLAGDAVRGHRIARCEVGVPEKVDARDGVREHVRERVGDAERDEPGGGAETRGHVAHPHYLQQRERRAEPEEDADDGHRQVRDESSLGTVHPPERPPQHRQHEANSDVGQREKDDGPDQSGNRRFEPRDEFAHHVVRDARWDCVHTPPSRHSPINPGPTGRDPRTFARCRRFVGMSELRRGLDAEGLERYSRHLFLEGVGESGQAALRDASVLVVGAGGLGAPVVQYLAAAGVGTLAVADHDAVERSNLQRQVIHGESDIGRPKVESAREFVAELNPDVAFEAHETQLAPENARSLVSNYDFVVDAADNFPTRYLINDACELEGVPRSFGAVHRFEGQVATFVPDGPCYRCVFPEAPPPGAAPDCATAGVLGVLPGTVGCLQATEAMKWILEAGELLTEELLVYDALGPAFERVSIERNPDCPVCHGEMETLDASDYEGDCRVSRATRQS